ncbi:DUF1254 domain-containing protein [Microbacterium aoyamense]|uniref:DUF1254 domain-containing protein n=1 Tax=Microbacterium aoyamense TaxID=344166 RepID=A0ABP5AV79_9MICO|nr:DUF1254 domain-containing protein [Microbacterium aoyamense]
MTTLSLDDLTELAEEAYSYFYPLVTMDATRLQLTDPASTGGLAHAAPNTLGHVRAFPPADFRAVVAPNFDTLYSSAWLDLSDGPLLLEVPDSGGRYYLMPFLDMWTDAFAVPGKRTTGTGAGMFLIVPPGWEGDAPHGASVLRAPTPVLWMIGRTQTNGPADYAAVNAFQDGLKLTRAAGGEPSHALRASVAPASLNRQEEPLAAVNALPATDFFGYASRLLAQYAPHSTDFSMLARLKAIGIAPGEEFDASRFDSNEIAALEKGAKAALQLQLSRLNTMARVANGWALNTDTMGVYGNYYLKRAIVTMIGLGANPAEDAVYPLLIADAAGDPVVGEKDYVQHFEASDLPPVNAFWSTTMYDHDSFQAPNLLNRFALGDRDALHYNADGSLDVFYGPTDPGGELTANWLPAPAGPLRIIMRLYSPKPSVLNGTWAPPPVTVR